MSRLRNLAIMVAVALGLVLWVAWEVAIGAVRQLRGIEGD
jgi:hypothetical protein